MAAPVGKVAAQPLDSLWMLSYFHSSPVATFRTALEVHYLSTACLYLSVKAPALGEGEGAAGGEGGGARLRLRGWGELVRHVEGTQGDHDIKFVDTGIFLARRFPALQGKVRRALSTLMKAEK